MLGVKLPEAIGEQIPAKKGIGREGVLPLKQVLSFVIIYYTLSI
jgi:hypothetical protein